MKRTGGKFDASKRGIYFLASGPNTFVASKDISAHVLMAINELKTPKDLAFLSDCLDRQNTILLDSGVYSLAMEHAAAHGITHDEALRTPLAEIDGFNALRSHYMEVVKRFGPRCWGYIEIDLGGRDQKRETRRELEAEGLKPIPVYHPLNDGWDYFDELAAEYDRICVGNIVQASQYVRLRLMSTLWERKRKYPKLWIHLLGLTANEWAFAYPVDSCDSSSWVSAVRWGGYRERCALSGIGGMDRSFQYKLKAKESWTAGIRMAAMGSEAIGQVMRDHYAVLADAGLV